MKIVEKLESNRFLLTAHIYNTISGETDVKEYKFDFMSGVVTVKLTLNDARNGGPYVVVEYDDVVIDFNSINLTNVKGIVDGIFKSIMNDNSVSYNILDTFSTE